ncbi:NAD(P)-binding protein [Polynucleobacter difficilis]|uniref:NAD(P)-binding protein n=1 Tax=Polynucleobacter difficilis TaxID=556054 RepID=UPI000D3B2491|nr:NAD(P)-binding protein [Polynucleobacter difficilis]
MEKLDIVVGGGIAGLLAALILSEKQQRKVILIERENELGGLLRSFDYGIYGKFDYGMHNMYETGIRELDEFLFDLLPDSEWQILEGSKRDLAGAIYAGNVQYNSPFIDLRNLAKKEHELCVSTFFSQLDEIETSIDKSAYEYNRTRFGDEIAKRLDQILRKQFGKSSKQLDWFANYLSTLYRVVLFGECAIQKLNQSNHLRELIAWPEQRTLPSNLESGRRAYYPKEYGMYRIVDSIKARLLAADVEVYTSSEVVDMSIDSDRVSSIKIRAADGEKTVSSLDNIIWTSGLHSAAKTLGINLLEYQFDRPRKTIVVNMVLERPPLMEDLYYLYSFELNSNIFRITNYFNYCKNATRADGWPISVELLIDEVLGDREMCDMAINQIIDTGIILKYSDVIFSCAEIVNPGFPMPTIKNFTAIESIRKDINSIGAKNLHVVGVQTEKDIFFQRDVISQVWKKMEQLN